MEAETVSNSTEAEEGEILNDDPEELYTPLERPHILFAVNNPTPQSDSDEDNVAKESSSDSDSSTRGSNPSKMRKVLPAKTKFSAMKKKNYNIWCTDLQTEILTSCLVDCNVDQSNERGRNVESYNYKLGQHSSETEKFKNSNVVDGNNKNWYLGKRHYNGASKESKMKPSEFNEKSKCKNSLGNSRNILGLSTTIENSEAEIAIDIANKLCEEKEDLILRSLNIAGKEAIISIFEKTKEIEASGGMLIMNGTRRRTPGGIFFFLLKTSEKISRNKINLIFLNDKKHAAEKKKRHANDMNKIKAAKLKETLTEDDFPTLLSRTQLAILQFKSRKLREGSGEVTNPPPSPATDGRDCSSDSEEQREGSDNGFEKYSREGRSLTTYDDLLGDEEDKMDAI